MLFIPFGEVAEVSGAVNELMRPIHAMTGRASVAGCICEIESQSILFGKHGAMLLSFFVSGAGAANGLGIDETKRRDTG